MTAVALLHATVGFVRSPIDYRWSFPENAASEEGLGAGIAWAISPDFCDRMLPLMQEGRAFVDCFEIKDALIRAASTWSANHPRIYFHDISDRCAEDGTHCEGLELYIQGMKPDDAGGSEAAYVEHTNFSEGVRTTAGYDAPMRLHPAGDIDGDGYVDGWNELGLRRSNIYFRTDVCWYMDATFCSSFHGHPGLASFITFAFATVWVLAFCGLAYLFVQIFTMAFGHRHMVAVGEHPEHAKKRPRRERIAAFLLREFSHGTALALVFFLLFPPLYFWQVFLPCVQW